MPTFFKHALLLQCRKKSDGHAVIQQKQAYLLVTETNIVAAVMTRYNMTTGFAATSAALALADAPPITESFPSAAIPDAELDSIVAQSLVRIEGEYFFVNQLRQLQRIADLKQYITAVLLQNTAEEIAARIFDYLGLLQLTLPSVQFTVADIVEDATPGFARHATFLKFLVHDGVGSILAESVYGFWQQMQARTQRTPAENALFTPVLYDKLCKQLELSHRQGWLAQCRTSATGKVVVQLQRIYMIVDRAEQVRDMLVQYAATQVTVISHNNLPPQDNVVVGRSICRVIPPHKLSETLQRSCLLVDGGNYVGVDNDKLFPIDNLQKYVGETLLINKISEQDVVVTLANKLFLGVQDATPDLKIADIVTDLTNPQVSHEILARFLIVPSCRAAFAKMAFEFWQASYNSVRGRDIVFDNVNRRFFSLETLALILVHTGLPVLKNNFLIYCRTKLHMNDLQLREIAPVLGLLEGYHITFNEWSCILNLGITISSGMAKKFVPERYSVEQKANLIIVTHNSQFTNQISFELLITMLYLPQNALRQLQANECRQLLGYFKAQPVLLLRVLRCLAKLYDFSPWLEQDIFNDLPDECLRVICDPISEKLFGNSIASADQWQEKYGRFAVHKRHDLPSLKQAVIKVLRNYYEPEASILSPVVKYLRQAERQHEAAAKAIQYACGNYAITTILQLRAAILKACLIQDSKTPFVTPVNNEVTPLARRVQYCLLLCAKEMPPLPSPVAAESESVAVAQHSESDFIEDMIVPN